jgi:hypothetical protein
MTTAPRSATRGVLGVVLLVGLAPVLHGQSTPPLKATSAPPRKLSSARMENATVWTRLELQLLGYSLIFPGPHLNHVLLTLGLDTNLVSDAGVRLGTKGPAPQPDTTISQLALSAPAAPNPDDSMAPVVMQQERACPQSVASELKGCRRWDVLVAVFRQTPGQEDLTLTVVPGTVAGADGQSVQAIPTSADALRDSATLVSQYRAAPSAHSATWCEAWQATAPVQCR